jgi:hypothetical protein
MLYVDEVKLSLWTAATDGPIFHPTYKWVWNFGGMILIEKHRKTLSKTCSNATLSTASPTLIETGENPGLGVCEHVLLSFKIFE